MLKKSIILFIIILFCHLLAAQKVTISGYIEDESSGEKLIGCNIFHPSTQSGTVSNTFGFYSITLDRDDVILLEISYIGYSAQSINISGQVSLSYNIKMKSEEDHYRFDTEKLIYEPLYEMMDLNPLVQNYVFQESKGQAGKDVVLTSQYFEAYLKNTKLKNGFVMTILELETMNGQMQALKAQSEALIVSIDEEMKVDR